jgi:hypothetical protein
VGSRVKVTDQGLDALKKRLAAASKLRLTVGVHEEEGAEAYPGGQTVAEVASYNEFGLGVPRRSFIADWVDESESAKVTDISAVARRVFLGDDAESSLGQLGPRYIAEVHTRMGETQADDPETVAEKGSSEPLEDSGKLRAAIKHQVRAPEK